MSVTAAEQNQWCAGEVLIGLDAWPNSCLRNLAASLLNHRGVDFVFDQSGCDRRTAIGDFCSSCSYFNRVPMLACPAEND
jgi:hypothetical protein